MQTCRFFLKGQCKYGNQCRYLHEYPTSQGAGAQGRPHKPSHHHQHHQHHHHQRPSPRHAQKKADEPTHESRTWATAQQQTPPSSAPDLKFRMVSYNLLADELALEHAPRLYPHVPRWCLSWEYRHQRQISELLHYSPDVICLQEVDHFQELEEVLRGNGYEGMYLQRTGNRGDGCATFWRTSKFQLSAAHPVRLIDHGLKDNVALITLLQPITPTHPHPATTATANQNLEDLDKKQDPSTSGATSSGDVGEFGSGSSSEASEASGSKRRRDGGGTYTESGHFKKRKSPSRAARGAAEAVRVGRLSIDDPGPYPCHGTSPRGDDSCKGQAHTAPRGEQGGPRGGHQGGGNEEGEGGCSSKGGGAERNGMAAKANVGAAGAAAAVAAGTPGALGATAGGGGGGDRGGAAAAVAIRSGPQASALQDTEDSDSDCGNGVRANAGDTTDRGQDRSVSGSGRAPLLLVGNTHILFNSKRGDIKLGQLRTMLRVMGDLRGAEENKGTGVMCLLAGDFNLTPDSQLYRFLSSSTLDLLSLDRRELSGQQEGYSFQHFIRDYHRRPAAPPPSLDHPAHPDTHPTHTAHATTTRPQRHHSDDHNTQTIRDTPATHPTHPNDIPPGHFLHTILQMTSSTPPATSTSLPCTHSPSQATDTSTEAQPTSTSIHLAQHTTTTTGTHHLSYTHETTLSTHTHVSPYQHGSQTKSSPRFRSPSYTRFQPSSHQSRSRSYIWTDEEIFYAAGTAIGPDDHDVQVQHPLSLRSSYHTALGSEPDFTTSHSSYMGTVDYIWYTGSGRGFTAAPTRVLLPPHPPDFNRGMPTPRCPSDHIALVCDYAVHGR